MIKLNNPEIVNPSQSFKEKRASIQNPLPVRAKHKEEGHSQYTVFPYQSIDQGEIFVGYDKLVDWMLGYGLIIVDGFSGVFWEEIQINISNRTTQLGLKVNFISTSDFIKDECEIRMLTSSSLKEKDSVWGKKTSLKLEDFFRIEDFKGFEFDDSYSINIIYGVGAALISLEAPIVYLDVPKNEIQYRMRAKSISNLGIGAPESSFEMYKRFFFVDWEVLNNHKRAIFNRISIVADTQWVDTLSWMKAEDWKRGLEKLSRSVFRARPWFEKGAWGGQWMKEKLKGLNPNEINYAWSFELITPENGVIFENNGNLLETAFDSIMIAGEVNLLGKHAKLYGTDFPIRFDFLDTFQGGNLSIQCHPSLGYIKDNFGETITQDETYYILDSGDKSSVYLGFQDDINPVEFKEALLESQENNEAMDIEKYVKVFESKKHDFFLIPNGTVHSAGANNLVLEISATPYIFTFKMYDWVRLDLNGKPRPINIEHAFNNLNFDRKGEKVEEELISKPISIAKSSDWEIIHLPTHKEHFYDVHRLEFNDEIVVKNDNRCHVMMLVEGSAIEIETNSGDIFLYQYAETFVISAAVKSYKLINKSSESVKVIKAFLK